MSYRLRFHFWLDMDNPRDIEIADLIELLKNERAYTAAIRDGLRLIAALRAGNTDMLFQLFPGLETELQRAQDVQAQLDDILRLLKRGQFSAHAEYSNGGGEMVQAIGKPLPLAAPTITAPVFDDDDDCDLLDIGNDTSTQSAQNFINSMTNLQGWEG